MLRHFHCSVIVHMKYVCEYKLDRMGVNWSANTFVNPFRVLWAVSSRPNEKLIRFSYFGFRQNIVEHRDSVCAD